MSVKFIEYWQEAPVHRYQPISNLLIPVLGDRGTIILDGRMSLDNMIEVAEENPRGLTYQICAGETLSRGVVVLHSKHLKGYTWDYS